MTDPIADMLNRIRNAQAVSKETVVIPFSNLKYEIAKILEKQKLVGKIEKKGRKSRKIIEIALKYLLTSATPKALQAGPPVISHLRRISKPGQRIYTSAKEIKPIREGYGILIVSTPKGLMTNKEAKRKKLGGEIICEIW